MKILPHLAWGALALIAAGAFISACQEKYPPLETVPQVDLQKYMGTWYEIASFPQRFQKGCHCTKAEYKLNPKGYVEVFNSCRKDSPTGKLKTAEGKAFVDDANSNSKLKVQFFWPFKGDYWIIDLANDYSYAVVGAPNREYLWILSREKTMGDLQYQQILGRIAQKGFDINLLNRTDQSCQD